MRIDILTLFPSMFDGFKTESIMKRAIEKGKVEINIIDIRDYTPYKNNQVDDYQFGGGGGMIMMCEPVYNAVESIRTEDSHVILLTPRGKTYNQKKAYEFKEKKHLIIICGHYEGFDERIYNLADEFVSIGNFIFETLTKTITLYILLPKYLLPRRNEDYIHHKYHQHQEFHLQNTSFYEFLIP